MNKIIFICILISVFFKISAQNGIQIEIDSLLKIVNDPKFALPEKINPMAHLSWLYFIQEDSLNAAKFHDQAQALALKQKDKKYLIYVYNQELNEIVSTYPRDIIRLYQVFDSIYTAIASTTNLEAQALGYVYIGCIKVLINPSYDFSDLYKSLSIAEELPDNSKKYRILNSIYRALYTRTFSKSKTDSENYLRLMLQVTEKTGDKSLMCDALTVKMHFILLNSPNNQSLISQHFDRLEDYLSINGPEIKINNYESAISTLVIAYISVPNKRNKESIDKLIENFKKIAGNNKESQLGLLEIEIVESYLQKNYAKTEKLLLRKIEICNTTENYFLLWTIYKELADIYSEGNRYQQATEAIEKSLDYYQQYTNAQMEEQRQLAEVKFETEKKVSELKHAKTENMMFLSIAILGIGFSILLIIFFKRQNTRNRLQKENAEQRAKLMEYENEMAHNKLMATNLQILKKNEMLEKITHKIADNKIQKLIRTDQARDKTYTDYAKIFGDIHPDFFEFLKKRAAPKKLTNLDLRYCAYIYMNKSNKEIADELNVSYYTVLSNKSDLKKKLKIDKNVRFSDFFQSIEG